MELEEGKDRLLFEIFLFEADTNGSNQTEDGRANSSRSGSSMELRYCRHPPGTFHHHDQHCTQRFAQAIWFYLRRIIFTHALYVGTLYPTHAFGDCSFLMAGMECYSICPHFFGSTDPALTAFTCPRARSSSPSVLPCLDAEYAQLSSPSPSSSFGCSLRLRSMVSADSSPHEPRAQ